MEATNMSHLEVSEKDILTPDYVFGENFTVETTNLLRLRVFSPDLERLFIETSQGLTLGLEPSTNSFFNSSIDDDASYKLCCSTCLHRLRMGAGVRGMPFCCNNCNRVYRSYSRGKTQEIWFSEGGVRLTMDKARRRMEQSRGVFPVMDPQALETFLHSLDFIEGLVNWFSPYQDPLQATLLAWESSAVLDQVWRGWKQVKKQRRVEKRLSGYRLLEQTFNDANTTWTRFPQVVTGEAVMPRKRR